MIKNFRAIPAFALAGNALAAMSLNAAAETSAERDARMARWREARLGMSIHWGICSIAAGD